MTSLSPAQGMPSSLANGNNQQQSTNTIGNHDNNNNINYDNNMFTSSASSMSTNANVNGGGYAPLSAAESSAIDKALKAGISRDEFEKTREGIMSMLRGQQRQSSHGSSNAMAMKATNEAISTLKRSAGSGRDALPRLSLSRKSSSSGSTAVLATNNNIHSKPSSFSQSQSSAGTGVASELNTPSTSTSTGTLRTSVSSSHFTDPGHEQQYGNSPYNGSPPTSEEEEEEEEEQAEEHDASHGGRRGSEKRKEKGKRAAQDDDADEASSGPRLRQDQDGGDSGSGSGLKKSSSDPDNSFNAANAAAAALGMLASSPIKHVAPSASTASSRPASDFAHHRHNNLHQLTASSSSPPPPASEPLPPSSTSPKRGDPRHHQPQRQHHRQHSGGRGKSTTPVRTRLEDIALKSSAQIRRQREVLGLGEADEMMDLDVDARHLDLDDDGYGYGYGHSPLEPGFAASAAGGAERPSGSMAMAGLGLGREDSAGSSSGGALAPAFAYQRSPAAASRSSGGTGTGTASAGASNAHRRGPSYDLSASARARGLGMGMLDRFMEESSSPKAAQIARFGGGAGEAIGLDSSFEDEDDDQHASARAKERDTTVLTRSGTRGSRNPEVNSVGFQDDREDDEEETDENRRYKHIQSTPRNRMNPSKIALLRSAGNDLPSPLLAQIRMLSEADYGSPAKSASHHNHHHHQQILGLSGPSSSDSLQSSARKRKASYDLTSPRHVVRPYDNGTMSPPPPSSMALGSPPMTSSSSRYMHGRASSSSGSSSPPPGELPSSATSSHPHPYPPFHPASPRFGYKARDSAVHAGMLAGRPGSSNGLFNGPPSSQASTARSHSNTPVDSQERPLNLFPYNQAQLRDEDTALFNPRNPTHHPHLQHVQDYPSRPSSAASDGSHFGNAQQQHLQQQQMRHHQQQQQQQQQADGSQSQLLQAPTEVPSSASKKRDKKKRQGSLTPLSASADGPNSDGLLPASTSVTPLPPDFVFADIRVGQYTEKTKPPFSYAALIGQSIFSTPNRRMSLADIYTYIMTLYPFYKKQDAGWQNSIRHNLSLNECFVKTQRGPDEPGKGCLWSVAPGTEEQFTGGNFYKKGKIPKSASSSSLAASSSRPPLSATSSMGGQSNASSSSINPLPMAASAGSASARRNRKAGSAAASETMSIASADDSLDNLSLNSTSFASANISQQHQQQALHLQQQQQHYAQPQHIPLQYQQQQQGYTLHMPPHQPVLESGYAAAAQSAQILPHHQQQQQQQQQQQMRNRPRASSNLRQHARRYYDDEDAEDETYANQTEDSFDMDPSVVYAGQHPLEQQTSRRGNGSRHQRGASGQGYVSSRPLRHHVDSSPQKLAEAASRRLKLESETEMLPEEQGSSSYRATPEYEQGDGHLQVEGANDRSYAGSERSLSAEPLQGRIGQQEGEEEEERALARSEEEAREGRAGPYVSLTSPIRRSTAPAIARRLLTSPPIMSSPPSNVFARMSQPYQPFRGAFNIPGQASDRVAALMSSPPPSGIMPSDSKLRGLPPPTPRSMKSRSLSNVSASAAGDGEEDDFQPGSSIFLPAPNIKPGKAPFGRRGKDGDEEGVKAVDMKPILPPISMMSSPVSAPLSIATQSPVSSIRGSAANNNTNRRSTSPSPKGHSGSNSQSSSASGASNRSPTLSKSKAFHASGDVFKTPDRFGPNSISAGGSSRISSPNKLAQIASTNASRALQSFQGGGGGGAGAFSTPKLPGARQLAGLVTPGGYYDPYEYGAVVDEELERMAASSGAAGAGKGDRRALPFPSPLINTPKYQPWSPW